MGSKVFANLSYQEAFTWACQVWQANPRQFQRELTQVMPVSMRLVWTDQRQHDFWDPLTTGTCVEKNFAEQRDCKITVEDLMSLQALVFIQQGDLGGPPSAKRRRKCKQVALSEKKKCS